MTESTARVTKDNFIKNDLGLFEGYNFRDQSNMDRLFIATEVINWDHHKDGYAQFWPNGEHNGVFEVFKRKDWYYEPDLHKDYFEDWEIQHLDELLDAFGDDPETYAKIAWHLEKGSRFLDITVDEIKEENLFVFRGDNFLALEEKAAEELLKNLYPKDFEKSKKSCCHRLTFDPYRFLSGRKFLTMEITIDNENLLIVEDLHNQNLNDKT